MTTWRSLAQLPWDGGMRVSLCSKWSEMDGLGWVLRSGPVGDGRAGGPGRVGAAGDALRQQHPADRAGGDVSGVEDEALGDVAVHVGDDRDHVAVVLAGRPDPGG